MKLHTCLALAATSFYLAAAQADSISPEPESGLWRRESTTLVNGQDMQLAIRNAQQQMLETLPPEQREMMESMMNPGGDPGVEMECISPQMAKDLTNPDALLKRISEDMPDYSMAINKVSGSTLAIAGSCAGNEGYAGEMQGELTIVSRREMRSRFVGNGTMQMDASEAPPAMQGMAGSQPVTIEHTEVSTWLSDDCADLEADQ